MKLYVKKCDNCGHGMNEGYYYSNTFERFCNRDCLVETLLRREVCLPKEWSISKAVSDGIPLWDKEGRKYLLTSLIENKEEQE